MAMLKMHQKYPYQKSKTKRDNIKVVIKMRNIEIAASGGVQNKGPQWLCHYF